MTVWGFILIAPRRPSEKDQRAIMEFHGLDHKDKTGPVVIQRIKDWTTRPELLCEEWEYLLSKATVEGDLVAIADGTCAGLTNTMAQNFVDRLTAKGVGILVGLSREPADEAGRRAIVAEALRAKRARNMARMRAKKRNSK